jgi:hypothetical protein
MAEEALALGKEFEIGMDHCRLDEAGEHGFIVKATTSAE